jgi:hypothetical protein
MWAISKGWLKKKGLTLKGVDVLLVDCCLSVFGNHVGEKPAVVVKCRTWHDSHVTLVRLKNNVRKTFDIVGQHASLIHLSQVVLNLIAYKPFTHP